MFAVPVSIGIALFITEIAPRRIRNSIVYVIDLLAAVPSVVFGLWGFARPLAVKLSGFYTDVSHWTKPIPLIGTMLSGHPVTGLGFMTAGLVLAIMITPIITSITREVFVDRSGRAEGRRGRARRDAVGDDPRRGLAARPQRDRRRGAHRSRPRDGRDDRGHARGRVGHVDHRAPLLARATRWPRRSRTSSARRPATYRAALVGLGVVLFLLTILIGVIARGFVARVEARSAGT